jgi:hypothetical protein
VMSQLHALHIKDQGFDNVGVYRPTGWSVGYIEHKRRVVEFVWRFYAGQYNYWVLYWVFLRL